MKNYRYILTVLMLYFMSGCVSLEETPMTFITPEQFFKTEADANAVCLGMYADMYTPSELWTYTSRGVQGIIDDGRMLTFNTLEPPANQSNHMISTWTTLYRCVRKTNTAIEGLQISPLEDFRKNPFLGEAKAMRAFAYLRLVKNWGDVPLHTSTFDPDYGVAPMEQVYEQIFKDLNEALYSTPAPGSRGKPGRLDRGACRILLADAALTIAQSVKSYQSGNADAAALKPYADVYGNQMNNYFTLARAHLDTLINREGYELVGGITKKWIDMFGRTAAGVDNLDNRETIIRTMTLPNLYWHGGEIRSVPGLSNYCPSNIGGVGLRPTYEYVASFHKDDIRRNEGFLWNWLNLGAGNDVLRYSLVAFRHFGNEPYDGLEDGMIDATNGFADYPNASAGELWGGPDADDIRKQVLDNGRNMWIIVRRDPGYGVPPCAKYYDASCLSGQAAISAPLYRLAEAYLMFAEAEVALNGVTQTAVDALNTIHVRAFPEALQDAQRFTLSSFVNADDFNKNLINEYLWEFCFENKDANVLIRFGKFQERMAKVVDTYQPLFSPSYTGPVLGVEAEPQGQYANKTRKQRGLEQYWLPYPHAGEETNPALLELTRMKY